MDDDQMGLAIRAMAHHAGESWRTDRTGWTDQQWIEDAQRLMDDIEGSVTSLVNGHVLALLRYWRGEWSPGDLEDVVEVLTAKVMAAPEVDVESKIWTALADFYLILSGQVSLDAFKAAGEASDG